MGKTPRPGSQGRAGLRGSNLDWAACGGSLVYRRDKASDMSKQSLWAMSAWDMNTSA
jgi:hypothetical protein